MDFNKGHIFTASEIRSLPSIGWHCERSRSLVDGGLRATIGGDLDELEAQLAREQLAGGVEAGQMEVRVLDQVDSRTRLYIIATAGEVNEAVYGIKKPES